MTHTPHILTLRQNKPQSKNDQQFYKLILIHHYIYKITTNKMNHITHDYTCYGVILLKLLQRIQQNCTDNLHLYLNYKLYFIHTYNVTNVQIVNWLTLKQNLKIKVHSQPYKNIQPIFLRCDKTNHSHKMISNFTN